MRYWSALGMPHAQCLFQFRRQCPVQGLNMPGLDPGGALPNLPIFATICEEHICDDTGKRMLLQDSGI